MPLLYRSDRIRAQDESLVPIMEHFEAVCLLDEFHVLSSFPPSLLVSSWLIALKWSWMRASDGCNAARRRSSEGLGLLNGLASLDHLVSSEENRVGAAACPPCSSLLLTAPRCSSLLLSAPPCSLLLLTAPPCSSLLLTAPLCFSLLALLLSAPHCSPCSSLLLLPAPRCSLWEIRWGGEMEEEEGTS